MAGRLESAVAVMGPIPAGDPSMPDPTNDPAKMAPEANGAEANGAAPNGPAANGPGANGARDATDGRAQIDRLADELLPALIARLAASRLGELEVTQGAWSIRLRRGAPVTVPPDGPERRSRSGGRAAAAAAGALDAAGTVGGADQQTAGGAARDSGRVTSTSPAVGYYVPRESAGVGQPVRSGDVVGYVDVLGVRQEVVAPIDGIIARHLAESGEAVEYGQELVRVERLSRGAPRATTPAPVALSGSGADSAPDAAPR